MEKDRVRNVTSSIDKKALIEFQPKNTWSLDRRNGKARSNTMRYYQNSSHFYFINHQINPLLSHPTSLSTNAYVSFSSYKQSMNTSGLPFDYYHTLHRPKRYMPNSSKTSQFIAASLESHKNRHPIGMTLPSYCTLTKSHKRSTVDSKRHFLGNEKKLNVDENLHGIPKRMSSPSNTLPRSKSDDKSSFVYNLDTANKEKQSSLNNPLEKGNNLNSDGYVPVEHNISEVRSEKDKKLPNDSKFHGTAVSKDSDKNICIEGKSPLYSAINDKEFDQASSSGCSSNNSYSEGEDIRNNLQPIGCTDVLPTGWHRHPNHNHHFHQNLSQVGTNDVPQSNKDFIVYNTQDRKIDLGSYKGLSVKDPEPFYHTLTNFKSYQKQQEDTFNSPSYRNSEGNRAQSTTRFGREDSCNDSYSSGHSSFQLRSQCSENIISHCSLFHDSPEKIFISSQKYDNSTNEAKRIDKESGAKNYKKSLKDRKNYNPSVITRSTSCVNAKLGAISQKIMFKGKEQRNQNKCKSEAIEDELIVQKSEKEKNKDRLVEENQSQIIADDRKSDDKAILSSLDHSYQLLIPENVGKTSEKTSLESPSRLLRRRHTTYIKEQGRSKSSLSILQRTDMESVSEYSSSDQVCSSASLNRSFLREHGDILDFKGNSLKATLYNKLNDNTLQSTNSCHRNSEVETNIKMSGNHHDTKKVRKYL